MVSAFIVEWVGGSWFTSHYILCIPNWPSCVVPRYSTGWVLNIQDKMSGGNNDNVHKDNQVFVRNLSFETKSEVTSVSH
jgi:hypothetical protein